VEGEKRGGVHRMKLVLWESKKLRDIYLAAHLACTRKKSGAERSSAGGVEYEKEGFSIWVDRKLESI